MRRQGRQLAVSSSSAAIILLALLLGGTAAHAATFNAFGPKSYTRANGQPVPVTEAFTVRNPAAPYRIQIHNGGANAEHPRVTAAMITLNGVRILSASDFNPPSTVVIEKTITLLASNQLIVELAGQAGTGFTLRILGEDNDGPVITASVAPPHNAAGWNKENVTVSFVCTDATSTVVACSAPVALTSEGAGQIVTGTATDSLGNTSTTSVAINIDKTAPAISAATAPAANAAGWHKADPTVTFSASDGLSGIASVTPPQTVTAEGAGHTITGTATDRAGNTATASALIKLDKTPPSAAATATPPPNAAGWNHVDVIVAFTATDALSGVEVLPATQTVTAEGDRNVSATIADAAGNSATATARVRLDKTPPVATIDTPADDSSVRSGPVAVSGSASDALSGVDTVQCGQTAATTGAGTFNCSVALIEGGNLVGVLVVDHAGNHAFAGRLVTLDNEPPALTLSEPKASADTNDATIGVAGSVKDNDGVAALTVNGRSIVAENELFATTVELSDGNNPINVVAADRAGNTATVSRTVTRVALPTVAITTPADLAVVRDAVATITGVATDAASVMVNGVAASVIGNGFTAFNVPLAQGRTVVTATATSTTGAVATDSVLLYRDSIPPRVVLRQPIDNGVVFQTPVDVTGMVDDIVVGTINSAQMSVTVNGIAAEVANRAFIARNVPLSPGTNTLTIVAADQGGNEATLTSRVIYQVVTGQPKIVGVSGGRQSATAGTALPAPLVVRLVDATGGPVAGRTVMFEVVENNGQLQTADGAIDRRVLATTNLNGEASVRWTLGTRAGAGNNRVVATAPDFNGYVEFAADGRLGAPALIVVDSGGNQYGTAGAPLPRPLIAIVVDEGNNRLANVPVTFSVAEGNGDYDGNATITVNTDTDGRAIATPSLGNAGLNVFMAGVASDPDSRATFVAHGRIAGPPSATSISGVVLDNTDTPVPGVSVRIDGTTIVTQSDEQGVFTVAGAPVGYVKLLVDGSTTRRPGTWPTLEYALYTVSGTDNTLEMPVYLLPIDTRRGLYVDETTGGTLALPELPGFSLTVKPGSATFPGGGRTGTVSVTLVHADKVPMAPGFGQQPRFIVTIQPPGVHFDPPAAISFPNVDGLSPGEITEMYSFDHDLGQFVSIGPAAVSADGTVLRSEPGVGIIKGGWHCGGNPSSSGTPHCCPPCKQCINNVCQPITGGLDADRGCCSGTPYAYATQCCVASSAFGQQLLPKNPWTPISCPNPVQRPGHPNQLDGCSVPPFLVPGNPQNPTGYPDMTFGNPTGSGMPQNGPCDNHDRCYQTCNPAGKAACDYQMFVDMLAVCTSSSAPLITKADCVIWATLYYDMLTNFGAFAFISRQREYCNCC